MYYFRIRATAFLWHQVRCIVGALFQVGQGLDEPEVFKQLLDIEANPKRPAYVLAEPEPLMLYRCEYDQKDLKFEQQDIEVKASTQGSFGVLYEQISQILV